MSGWFQSGQGRPDRDGFPGAYFSGQDSCLALSYAPLDAGDRFTVTGVRVEGLGRYIPAKGHSGKAVM
jgi:hypothetical protein